MRLFETIDEMALGAFEAIKAFGRDILVVGYITQQLLKLQYKMVPRLQQ